MHAAFQMSDHDTARRTSAQLLASRPTQELAYENQQLGLALARILVDLGVEQAASWRNGAHVTYEALFALAAAHWSIAPLPALAAYGFSWCEMLVTAAIKLVPLGQTQGHRILAALIDPIEQAAERAVAIDEDDLSSFAPLHAMASALHETQYSRLFRS
jgi:urease accessory protein